MNKIFRKKSPNLGGIKSTLVVYPWSDILYFTVNASKRTAHMDVNEGSAIIIEVTRDTVEYSEESQVDELHGGYYEIALKAFIGGLNSELSTSLSKLVVCKSLVVITFQNGIQKVLGSEDSALTMSYSPTSAKAKTHGYEIIFRGKSIPESYYLEGIQEI